MTAVLPPPQATYSRPIEPYLLTPARQTRHDFVKSAGNQAISSVTVALAPLESVNTGTSLVSLDQTGMIWAYVIRSVQGLENLQDDWDGQGAEAPSLAIIRAAIRVAENFQKSCEQPPVTAVATPAGTVLFTWEDQSSYFEFEIASPDRLEWMQKEQGKPATHGETWLPQLAEGFDRFYWGE